MSTPHLQPSRSSADHGSPVWGAYNRLGWGFKRNFHLTDLHLPTLLQKSTTHPFSLGLKGGFYGENSTNDTPEGRIPAEGWTENLPHPRPDVYREPDREGLINAPKIDLNSAENIFQKGGLWKSNSAKTV